MYAPAFGGGIFVSENFDDFARFLPKFSLFWAKKAVFSCFLKI